MNNEEMQVEQEAPVVQEIDYKAFYDANHQTIDKLPGLLNKQKELLAETKAAKEEKRRIEEMTKAEQKTLAEKNGEFEKLFRQRDADYKSLEQQLSQHRQERRNEKIELQANKIASELAKGDSYKAELLSVFVAKNIGNIADDNGVVDADALSSIRKQIETDARYQPLLGGNQSVGGSAPGNTRSASVDNKTISMADYNNMNPAKKLEFAKLVQSGKAEII